MGASRGGGEPLSREAWIRYAWGRRSAEAIPGALERELETGRTSCPTNQNRQFWS